MASNNIKALNLSLELAELKIITNRTNPTEIFANEPSKIFKSRKFINYFERVFLGAERYSIQKVF